MKKINRLTVLFLFIACTTLPMHNPIEFLLYPDQEAPDYYNQSTDDPNNKGCLVIHKEKNGYEQQILIAPGDSFIFNNGEIISLKNIKTPKEMESFINKIPHLVEMSKKPNQNKIEFYSSRTKKPVSFKNLSTLFDYAKHDLENRPELGHVTINYETLRHAINKMKIQHEDTIDKIKKQNRQSLSKLKLKIGLFTMTGFLWGLMLGKVPWDDIRSLKLAKKWLP